MARRCVLNGGSGPLRISVTGVDADAADFDEVLFDADYPSLRSLMSGSVLVSDVPTGFGINWQASAVSSKVMYGQTFTHPLLAQIMWSRTVGTYNSASLSLTNAGAEAGLNNNGCGILTDTDGFYCINAHRGFTASEVWYNIFDREVLE